MATASEPITQQDRRAILVACELVRSEPTVAALTVGLKRPDLFSPGELERYCVELAEDQGVDVEILPEARSVRVARRRRGHGP